MKTLYAIILFLVAMLAPVFLCCQETSPAADQPVLPAGNLAAEDDWNEGMGLLGVGRDLFLRRASFDFSAGFFRMRGYDGRERALVFNDIPLNDLLDGRPQWHLMGGLTDLGRYAEEFIGRSFTPYGFGGQLGLRNIQAWPSTLRPGIRFTVSASNRSYRWREMLTYNSGLSKNGFGYLLSVAHRSGPTGYFEGTPYNSLGGVVVLEWQLSHAHTIRMSGLYSRYRRGLNSPLSAEVTELLGHRYNPNWGWSDGKIRSARERLGSDPLMLFGYRFKGIRSELRIALAHRWGIRNRTRLSYFGGPNPDPVYYRNLPSYYLNRGAGPNFQNAKKAREALLSRPQIQWDELEESNRKAYPDGRAVYLLEGSQRMQREWMGRSWFKAQLTPALKIDGGIQLRMAAWDFSSRPLDLLGAKYHLDIDPFTDTRNDLLEAAEKKVRDPIGYSYRLVYRGWRAYLQTQWKEGLWSGEAAFQYGGDRLRRIGGFKNERYPEHSLGPAAWQSSEAWRVKAGLAYRFNGRAWIMAYWGYDSNPPLPENAYVDPRQHDGVFPSAENRGSTGASLNLHLRHPLLKGRITAFYQEFWGGRSLRSYFTETSIGAAFVREVIGGIATRHQGLEWGLEIPLQPSLTLHFAGTLSRQIYTEPPRIWLFADPVPGRPTAFDKENRWDAGALAIRGRSIARGPQSALSLGLGYRAPRYWWLDLRTVFLGGRFLSPAMLRYTDSFAEPRDGEPSVARPDINDLHTARQQRELPPVYLLNLSMGKSWRIKGHYISAFIGLNNAFDLRFRTGGYEQGRLATLQGVTRDLASGQPSFGARYFQGTGRTFFMNVSWSF